ncbi:hypothetical protein [Streptomyces marianii]|uniref:Uncharacterized protein n=1 Tax=Streptomyces marianii TaxID=1817406 RepID=A0A5R9DU64_9ACTN|nr:hypothetical protein [Streptomyces marianii]TLQ39288.1 hypothetical protein FEF34_38495 [Streptomyces marianii]
MADRKDDLLSLNEIAKLADVSRQAAQKWHKPPAHKKPRQGETEVESALRSVARAMGVEVPESYDDSPRYPRKVVVAFLKAVGYMDENESLMPRRGGKGKWTPAEPTIDPHRVEQPDPAVGGKPLKVDPQTGGRYRYYVPHAWAIAGFGSETSFNASRTRGRAPEPDGIDELERPYWWLETLEGWKADAPERKAKRYAGRRPDGYTPDGQPFRLLPGDNYYARKAAEQAGEAADDESRE